MSLRQTYLAILNDLPNTHKGFKVFVKAYFFNPSFRVLLNYRIGRYCFNSKLKILILYSSRKRMKMISKRNCDISFSSQIGKSLKFAHPIGVVIGSKSVIKDNVTIFQNVTLGSHGKKGELKSYPTLENGVIIYSGVIIIGGVTIGENSIIGANTFVNCDIPSNCIAYGSPIKIERLK